MVNVVRADVPLPATVGERGAGKLRPMAILDRDGVVNRDSGYVCTPDRFDWVVGAPEAIRALNESGFRVVIATNQSGIGRGLYTEHVFEAFMGWVAGQLAQRGARFDACVYCPHHPTAAVGEYRIACECRKPKPGMLLKALAMFPTETRRSFLIGDRKSDLIAARAAGVRGYRFDGRTPIGTLVDSILAEVAK